MTRWPGTIAVDCALYLSAAARQRTALTLSCGEVVSMSCTIDFLVLRDHARAGNISNARPQQRAGLATLKIFLADGYLEIRARTISLGATTSSNA